MQGNEQSQDVGNFGTSASRLTFTVADVQALEAAYKAALEAGQSTFEHGGLTYTMIDARNAITALVTEFERCGLWPLQWS